MSTILVIPPAAVFTATTEQFIGVNEDSPTFNRLRANYTQFFPVNWLKLHKGCRPKPGEKGDCHRRLVCSQG